MKHHKFDLERGLRARRTLPRVEFAQGLADEIHNSRGTRRSPLGRVGLALALSGLIVVALASFGLPFTGLALWMPLAIGFLLVSLGLVLRTRSRRRDAAH